MELEEKLKEEASALLDRIKETDPTSEEYTKMTDRLRILEQVLAEETKRNNSTLQMELETKKLDVERDKLDNSIEQSRLSIFIEEEKLKMQKRSNWWELGLKFAGGVISFVGNMAQVYTMVRFNNDGVGITPFESKFIFPERIGK